LLNMIALDVSMQEKYWNGSMEIFAASQSHAG
jgi:hypothetical protein